jgi:hypothetical protein
VDWKSKITVESAAYPGARVVIRRLNRIQRARLQAEQSEQRLRYQEASLRLQELGKLCADDAGESFDLAKLTTEQAEEYRRLDMQLGQIGIGTLRPLLLRRVFVSIEGFTVDDVPPTIETLIESGPDDLLDEIAAAAMTESLGLTEDQRKNSQSAGTSPEPEPAQPITIAPLAAL